MLLIAIIEAVATALWTYTAVTFVAWINHIRQREKGAHVPAVMELLGHLVPAMIALVVVVLFGALIGLPSVVAFIALLFPAGTAYGTHMALAEAQEKPSSAIVRLVATALLTTAIIAYRSGS